MTVAQMTVAQMTAAPVTRVLAALDRGPAAKPVLAAARALAALVGAEATALHVRVDGDQVPRSLAAAAGVPLRVVGGDVVANLVAAAGAPEVVALVIGARGIPADPRPLGAVAAATATAVAKPVMVVPPDAVPPARYRRVLVPLEGSVETSLAPRPLIELAVAVGLDVVALHVLGLDTVPAFTDQPQHEFPVWADEFLARHCPWGSGAARLETRVGRCEDIVPLIARECGCDLIVLAWSQAFTPGRARVVRGALQRCRVPVVLVPVRTPAGAGRAEVEAQPP
ncbi:universal stress protein [Planosporangium thailandense]|uniref:Universal stress protein n=1 Tax=Planosporangium thailandense TaxID=765197 RepID=A0ABX0Y7K1_9ACTN|nr:universal stress protein [Planosporangium thailandense]NJC73525.1 universal stress protein [Planosporangium thailandense]